MKGRTYSGANLGISRMNKIIDLAREHGPLAVRFVCDQLNLNEKSSVMYLHRLTDMHLMEVLPREKGNAPKLYQLLPGAQPLPVPVPVFGPRKSRAKPGSTRGRPRLKFPGEEDRMMRRVNYVPAVQLGVTRDPLLQAFYGDWRAA